MVDPTSTTTRPRSDSVSTGSGSAGCADHHTDGTITSNPVITRSESNAAISDIIRNNTASHRIYGYDDASDDLQSGEVDRPYSGVFEGPEKTLEVFFRKIIATNADFDDESSTTESNSANVSNNTRSTSTPHDANYNTGRVGMRKLNKADLDRICRRARCTILSSVSNQYLDAYVLSESSLFVYPQVVVLKTCGTTTLLRCIATLIELGRRVGLEIDWVGYSRKNFNFPWDQAFPHESFYQELEYLSSHRSLCERLDGNGYTLGPVTGDHWFVFVADQTVRIHTTQDTDRVLNMMMFDIDQTVAKKFYYDRYTATTSEDETPEETVRRISKAQTTSAGIDALCPGYDIDPRAFEPCGYSMNAILFRSYSTMHITPEESSSYASFETNQQVASYTPLINNVVRTFRPKRLVMTLMADEDGLKQMKHNPFVGSASDATFLVSSGIGGGGNGSTNNNTNKSSTNLLYKRSSVASIQVEDDCCCFMGNWVLQEVSKNSDSNPVKNRPRGYSVA